MGNGPPRPQNHDIGSGIPAILVLSSHSPRCQFRPAIRHQASHLTSACTWTSTVTNGLMALLHTFLFQLDKRGTTFHQKSMFLFFMLLHVRMFTGKHGVGKGAKTKQPTITTACQWSQQRLSMQSHKEGSKSQLVPVCLYSLTASQNPRQLRLSKIVDTIPSVVL